MSGNDDTIPEWIIIINLVVSGISIIIYFFYIYLLIKQKGWEYSLKIKAYLVFISFCQSSYYFVSLIKVTEVCQLFGSIDIFLEFGKISLSFIILLLNTNDKLNTNYNIKSKHIFLTNFIFSFLLPLGIAVITYFFGGIEKLYESFCFPKNTNYKIVLNCLYGLYYGIFFILVIYISRVKIKKGLEEEQEEKNVLIKDTESLEESVIKNGIQNLQKSILFYTLIQVFKCLLQINFVFNLICTSPKNSGSCFCNVFGNTIFFHILSVIFQNISILLFLLAFGFDNINGINLLSGFNQKERITVFSGFESLVSMDKNGQNKIISNISK